MFDSRPSRSSVALAVALLAAVTLAAACSGPESIPRSSGVEPAELSRRAPSCKEVMRFTEQMVDVGITYDYQPSSSPKDLASHSDAVFAGVLTGGFEASVLRRDTGELDFVAYEVEVTDVIVAFGALAPGTRQLVSVSFNSYQRSAADYEAAIAVGARVVVFASTFAGAPGGLSVGVEGFATACDGAVPVGLVGHLGEWKSLQSLDELIAASR